MSAAPFSGLLSRSLLAMMLKATGGVMAVVMAAALARALGPEEFGQFARLLSAGLILAQLALMGQSKLVLRFMGDYRATGQHALARGLIKASFARLSLACAFIIGGIALGAAGGAGFWAPLILLVPALALADYYTHLARALGALGWALAPFELLWRGGVAAIAIALWLSTTAISGRMALSGAAIALLLIVLTQRAWLVRRANQCLGLGPTKKDSARWHSAGRGFWGLSILALSPQLMVVLLGAIAPPELSGALFACLRVTALMSLPLFALNLAGAPEIAGAMALGQTGAVQHMFRRAMRVLAPTALLAAIALGLCGPSVLSLFGEIAPTLPFLILLIGALANALTGPVGVTLQMSGYEHGFLLISALATGIGAIALCWAAPRFGLIGAAGAISLMQVLSNAAAALLCRTRLGLDPSALCLFPQRKDNHARSAA